MASANSKEAQALLIDPLNAPEPASETGLNTHFRSTFGPAPGSTPTPSTTSSGKKGPQVTERETTVGEDISRHRAEAFGDAPRRAPAYEDAMAGASSSGSGLGRRRTSSLKERFPGDESQNPLDVIRRASKKADRSPHLNKRHLPGPDVIDRLDPALGGRAYHHEGPYDAAGLAKNTKYDKYSPVAALQTTNEEALKATPRENIKDAVNRHKPLDGVAFVPPGMPDKFGRTYNYEEGTDMAGEPGGDAGYKRWPDREYDDEDHKGQSEPSFSLDRALRAHKIDDDGIEMGDRAQINRDYHRAERKGTLDTRDPVEIAGNDAKYAGLEHANVAKDVDADNKHGGGLRGLKNRIGSLTHRKHEDE
ncbi:hypothetical protein LTR91_019392 [Friedmanniomyces endolithicus]|uniref:Pal1 cell morphology protein n=1 Tax=Friedmanniomyces endolithicus TaxID=329885 RepID=A0AAN6HAR1_9PEZI|nr:hypothetical protein LTS09_007492 [Friedmanniomyces endolithicus]KAK0343874.1 hypothetical protein LTR94_016574 [Friedmanniomyces endolithicus]KAK0775267.1 hypothetical protein LTR59_014569 [Friedmanniomyces endolithicus]KAK0794430.1 hypothetical protein LTR38_009191 [Friedmanniomyces endolithicus]KAK0840443.1 hypothetical protein LTR03_010561 [Friedmanniomyces endolithicus]